MIQFPFKKEITNFTLVQIRNMHIIFCRKYVINIKDYIFLFYSIKIYFTAIKPINLK